MKTDYVDIYIMHRDNNDYPVDEFIDGEYNMEHTYIKRPSKKNCRFCEFNQTEHCDAGVK